MINHRTSVVAWLALAFMTPVSRMQACAVCFGKSDSAMAQGMNSGILFLLAVVAMVLGGLITLFGMFIWRARQLAKTQAALAASNGGPIPLVPLERAESNHPGRGSLVGVRTGNAANRPTCRGSNPRR